MRPFTISHWYHQDPGGKPWICTRTIYGWYKTTARIISSWFHIDQLLVGCVMISVTEHLRPFVTGLQFPASLFPGRNDSVPLELADRKIFSKWLGLLMPWNECCALFQMTERLLSQHTCSWQRRPLKEAVGNAGATFPWITGSGEKSTFPMSQSWGCSLIRGQGPEVLAPDFLQIAQSMVIQLLVGRFPHSWTLCWEANYDTNRRAASIFLPNYWKIK